MYTISHREAEMEDSEAPRHEGWPAGVTRIVTKEKL